MERERDKGSKREHERELLATGLLLQCLSGVRARSQFFHACGRNPVTGAIAAASQSALAGSCCQELALGIESGTAM